MHGAGGADSDGVAGCARELGEVSAGQGAFAAPKGGLCGGLQDFTAGPCSPVHGGGRLGRSGPGGLGTAAVVLPVRRSGQRLCLGAVRKRDSGVRAHARGRRRPVRARGVGRRGSWVGSSTLRRGGSSTTSSVSTRKAILRAGVWRVPPVPPR